jgi:lipid-binding SYLF domain-containing protein
MSLLLMSSMGLFGTYVWAGSAREETVDRLQKSVEVLHAIMATPDKGIPEEVLSNAKCIQVVPANGWSAPAFVSVGVEVGDCRLVSKALTWSCWS